MPECQEALDNMNACLKFFKEKEESTPQEG